MRADTGRVKGKAAAADHGPADALARERSRAIATFDREQRISLPGPAASAPDVSLELPDRYLGVLQGFFRSMFQEHSPARHAVIGFASVS